jgi:hypothetical protein
VAMTMIIEPRCSWLSPSAIAKRLGSHNVAAAAYRSLSADQLSVAGNQCLEPDLYSQDIGYRVVRPRCSIEWHPQITGSVRRSLGRSGRDAEPNKTARAAVRMSILIPAVLYAPLPNVQFLGAT